MKRIIPVIMAFLIAGHISAAAAEFREAALLTYFEGDVKMMLNDENSWGDPIEEMVLQEEDSIRTGPGGKAKLVLQDESSITIGPLSEFRIGSVVIDPSSGSKNAEFNLEQGLARARVTKLSTGDSSFTITTPTAVAGVRGTDFVVESLPDENRTTVSVLDGEVEVSSRIAGLKEKVKVIKEQATDVIGGGPPAKPRKMEPEKIRKFKTELAGRVGKDMPGRQMTDQQAAAVVAVHRTGISEQQVRNVVTDIKSGDLSAGEVKVVAEMKDMGVPGEEIASTLNVIADKQIPEGSLQDLVRSVRESGYAGEVSEKLSEFRERAQQLEDRPGRGGMQQPAMDRPEGDRPPPSGAAGQQGAPPPPDMNIDDKQREIREGTDQRMQEDAQRKEQEIIRRAIELGIPRDRVDMLVQALRDNRMDLRELEIIVGAVGRGVDMRVIDGLYRKFHEARIGPTDRLQILKALRLGMTKDKLEAIIEKLKQRDTNLAAANEAREELNEYIDGAIKTPPPPDDSVTDADIKPPPTVDNTDTVNTGPVNTDTNVGRRSSGVRPVDRDKIESKKNNTADK